MSRIHGKPENQPRVVVIGAGVGGLAAAIRLAAAGARVTLCERSSWLGGKLRTVEVGGRAIAAGPTVLTMPHIFEELFAAAGTRLSDRLRLRPIDPACRHFFPDGSRLDLFQDDDRSREALRVFAGEKAVRQFDTFRARAATIYATVKGPFMERALPSSMLGFLNPSSLLMVPGMLKIDALRTLWKSLAATFDDERLRVLFGRYATYNGSSPFHAPATLAVITHVELAFGIHAVEGGIARLGEVLGDLCRELGVEIRTDTEVERVVVEKGRVQGVRVKGELIAADAVVANCDVLELYRRLLADEPTARSEETRIAGLEPSLSAFLMLAVAPVGEFPLAHHNVFFSGDYKREFDQLIEERRPPDEPTVYICSQDRGPSALEDHAALQERHIASHKSSAALPQSVAIGERHLLLTNAPALVAAAGKGAAAGAPIDWSIEAERCRERMLGLLSRHGLPFSPTAEKLVTPAELAQLFPSTRGSIYGASSNSRMAAFERPPNKVSRWRGLYCVGGSAHPGAGLPMVTLSAKIATEQAIADLGLGR